MKTVPILALAVVCSLLPANGQDKNAVTLAKTIPLPDVPGGLSRWEQVTRWLVTIHRLSWDLKLWRVFTILLV